jgi:hypothetical protein
MSVSEIETNYPVNPAMYQGEYNDQNYELNGALQSLMATLLQSLLQDIKQFFPEESSSNGIFTGSPGAVQPESPGSGTGGPTKVDLQSFSDLQLPVGSGGHAQDIHGDLTQIQNQFFIKNPDGSVTFSVPDGDTAKNSGSSYPRSELSENGSWHMSDGTATMSATLRVDKMPNSKDIVIGQIHERQGVNGKPRPPVELHYTDGKIVASVMDNNNSASAGRHDVVIATNVKPGQQFSYSMSLAKDGNLTIQAAGQTKTVQLDPSFSKSDLYFKAGNYTQDASSNNGGSAVTFSGLDITHD